MFTIILHQDNVQIIVSYLLTNVNINVSSETREALSLSEVYPKDYSISCYPPDFLVLDNMSGEWKFVEVKSPSDKLRFKQANWFVNLLPKTWKYEIFASLNQEFDKIYLCNFSKIKRGVKFTAAYSEKEKSVKKFKEICDRQKNE